MIVLVGCEESQEVCKAFRVLGIEAYSNDTQDCSGGHPEWHLKMDVFEAVEKIKPTLAIFHPPCTFVSRAGARWLFQGGKINQDRYQKGMSAKDFFMKLWNLPIRHIAIENPTPLKIFQLPKYSQAIQPYQYGHEFSKRTLLWLKNLPELIPTDIKENFAPYLPSNTGGKKRGQVFRFKNISQKDSSKTFSGIAKAMAEQWSAGNS